MRKLLTEIIDHRDAFRSLVEMNVRTTVASSRLGWVWWVVDPIIMMAVYYFVIGIVFQRGGENYHLFVLTGVVAWQFFSRSLSNSASALSRSKSLIHQFGIPLPILIGIPPVVQSFFAFIGMVIVIVWSFENVGIHSLSIILLLILIVLMSYGIGLFLAVFESYYRDVGKVVSYLLRAGFFFSPVLYPAARVLESDSIPEIIKVIFQINPMVWILTAVREIILQGEMFDLVVYLAYLLVTFAIIQSGLLFLRKHSNAVTKIL